MDTQRPDNPPDPAFAQHLVALLPRLRRYARVLTGDAHTADDLVQDTLERGWSRHAQWLPGTDLRAWLFSIMHNRRVDLLRGQRAQVESLDDDDFAIAPAEPRAAETFEPIDLQRAFERLTPDHREIMMLVVVEQLSYEEAADAIGVPTGTVMSRLSRARALLRAMLDAPAAGSDSAATAPAARPGHLTRIK